MNLYLIRHAIAVDRTTEVYEDAARPLTDVGRKKMRQIASGLKSLGVEFDLILSSPYIRARETAMILADTFKMKQKIIFSEHLAQESDPNLLITEIDQKYLTHNLALVGHEPGLSMLTGLLVSKTAQIDMKYKKGGVCKLTVSTPLYLQTASLEWLLTPKILMKIASK